MRDVVQADLTLHSLLLLLLAPVCCSDPLRKETSLNAPAIKKWLQVGAQPSETVTNLLKKAYVIEPNAIKVEVPRVEL